MKNIYIILMFPILIGLTTCTVFEEQSVTNESVNILVPGDGTTVTSQNLTFSWSEFESSNPIKYNLQVVSPNFENPSFYVIDTITSKTKYTKTLTFMGQYQCRVNIQNGTSKSAYKTISFVLDTTNPIIGPVHLISPSDNGVFRNKSITLAWDALKYATKYKIQVISIDTVTHTEYELIKETDTVTTRVTYILGNGTYKWQVRAYNGGSTTDFVSRTFKIDTIQPLNTIAVSLASPSNDSYYNKNKVLLNWVKMNYATSYKVEITPGEFNGTNQYPSYITTFDTLTATFPTDGAYQWRVTAINAGSNSLASVPNKITILTQSPSIPVLNTPADNATTTSPINFSWTQLTPNITDSLFVYSSDSTTLVAGFPYIKSYSSGITTYSVTINSSGQYFWRMRSSDRAGNASNYTVRRKFYVQ